MYLFRGSIAAVDCLSKRGFNILKFLMDLLLEQAYLRALGVHMPSLVLGLEDFLNLAFTGMLERVSVEV